MWYLIHFVVRIVGVFVCSKKAKELNRNSNGWGLFGFISPILAICIIYAIKPLDKLK
jgi:hypothetical protein